MSSRPVVLITGVSGGIGRATARVFAAHGWIVVGTIRQQRETVALKSAQYDLQKADMANAADLERVVFGTNKTYGRLDAVVCNAGYGLVGPIDSLDYHQMLDQLTVNTLAPAELARLVVPILRKQGRGALIGVSSVAGVVGLPGYSLYTASKFGLNGLFEALSYELEGSNIRVRLIEPSTVNTAFWATLRKGSGRAWDGSELGSKLGDLPEQTHKGLTPERVAMEVYASATDRGRRLHYPLGYTRYFQWAKRLLPERLYRSLVRRVII